MSSKKISEQQEKNYFNIFLKVTFLGIGLGVIAGTLLKINAFKIIKVSPEDHKNISKNNQYQNGTFYNSKNKITGTLFPYSLRNKDEIKVLNSRWKELALKKSDLQVSAFMLLIDEGKYAQLSPNKILPAASSIKTAILLMTLEMVDAGHIKWDEELTLSKDVIGGGAGWMSYQPLGTTFPIHEIATEMIRISDNTATNLLIKRLGGKIAINKSLKNYGLISTEIKNYLPDLEGSNTTTAKDLAYLMALVDSGNLLSFRSRDLFREIMATSKSNRLIPGGILEGLNVKSKDIDYNLMIKGYKVYNKTGDIGIAYSDSGLIQLPNNTRAVAGFIVKGPFNDPRSSQLIRDMASEMIPFLIPKKIKLE